MKTTRIKTRLILLAAIASVPVVALTAPARAQYQSSQSGDALDANRRIGDSGRNDVNPSYRMDNRLLPNSPRGNNIITGNVTGAAAFRDRIGYRDVREFGDVTSTERSDAFIRRSAGTAGAANRVTDYNVSVPFYPAGRTVNPPPGFVQQNLAGGGYVPSDAIDSRVDRGRVAPRTGSQMVLPGPMDTTGATSVITASPLTGIQQAPFGGQSIYGQPLIGQRTGVLDEATIERMRMELRTGGTTPSGDVPAGAPTSGSQAPGTDPLGPQSLDQPVQPGLGETIGQPQSPQQQQQQQQQRQQQPGAAAIDARVNTSVQSQPLQGGAGNLTGQATRVRVLPPVGEQTPAYAELRRKLDEYANNKNLTDEQAFRAARRAKQEAEAAATAAQTPQPSKPGPDGATTRPAGAPADPNAPQEPQSNAERLGLTDFSRQNEELLKRTAPRQSADLALVPAPPAPSDPSAPAVEPQAAAPAPAAPAPAELAKPAPAKIDSLARGVPGKGLADLLAGAEALMKEGKFTSALEKYDQAEQVAPNNPLIKLGRANAELGAGYFARAETHLREAFNADAALLMGQYDLPAFFGEERLTVIANDLKEIANTEQAQARPVFLLAYVAYNSGNERMAAGYLDLAEQRSGGKDPLIKKIREHWTFPPPEAEPAAPAQPEADPSQAETPPEGVEATK